VAKTKIKQQQAIKEYKAKISKTWKIERIKAIKKALVIAYGKPILENLKYDADNGYFIANLRFAHKKEFNQKVAIKVPRKHAKAFKNSYNRLSPKAIFEIDSGNVKLKDIKIPFKHKSYMANFTDISIDDTKIAVNLSNDTDIDTNINTDIKVAKSQLSTFDTSKLKDYNALDRLLKSSHKAKEDSKKWLFVVGIEQYEFTDNISYATRSAKMFAKMAYRVLGVPKQNSYIMINSGASQAKIKTNFKKLLKRVAKGDTIYFYYNGHGVPVPSLKNEPFMLSSDTEPDYVQDEKFFSLQNIYSKLSSSKASKVVAVVDSCFSGVTDGKAVLKGVAATRVKPKSVKFNKSKMVVLSAGKSHQYSNGYDKKAYRLFSYFVIKNILEGKKDIKSLYKNTKTQTYNTSLKEYGDLRVQEPTIEGNFRMKL